MSLADGPSDATNYLDKNWNLGGFELISGFKITRIPIRYNSELQYLEVQDDGLIRVCHLFQIRQFYYDNGRKTVKFVNAQIYDAQATGIYELVYRTDQNAVVRRLDFSSDFLNERMNEKSDKHSKKNVSYEYIHFNNNTKKTFYRNKKSILAMSASNSQQISNFIRDHHINLRKEHDFIELISYYFDLMEK